MSNGYKPKIDQLIFSIANLKLLGTYCSTTCYPKQIPKSRPESSSCWVRTLCYNLLVLDMRSTTTAYKRTFVLAKFHYNRSKGTMSWNETQVDQGGAPLASAPKTLALDTDVQTAFVAEVRLCHSAPPISLNWSQKIKTSSDLFPSLHHPP